MHAPVSVKDISPTVHCIQATIHSSSPVWAVMTCPSATELSDSILMNVFILVLQFLRKPIIVSGHVRITVGKFENAVYVSKSFRPQLPKQCKPLASSGGRQTGALPPYSLWQEEVC